MSGGFTRRYGAFPGNEVVTQIEGVVIIDSPPPGTVQGRASGVCALVGEFPDMSYACAVSATGVVTESLRPVEIYGPADLVGKVGGFDETLGEFGVSRGNGFVALRNKRFSRLILMPVNLITPAAGSTHAVRCWRDLPTNRSATDARPIVPLSQGVVAAGREFLSGASALIRVARRLVFSDAPAYASGIDGTVTAGVAAVTNTFTRAAGSFITDGAQVGDILVVGVIGGAAGLGANAATYRVTAVTDALNLQVEKMSGLAAAWTWTTAASLPWRLHAAATADSAGVDDQQVNFAAEAGYTVLARPTVSTVAAAQAAAPVVTPTAGSATAWDPLSGLAMATHPTGALTYDANVHAPNAVLHATITARYQSALDALISDDYPARDINIVWTARTGTTIRAWLKAHVAACSARGLTRRGVISPETNQTSIATVLADADPGVGANRLDRLDYAWPAVQTSVPEAVGFSIKGGDGRTYTDGILDDATDGWLASVESNLAPERNPGQAAQPIPAILATVLGIQRGVTSLGMPEYIQLRQQGIVGIRMDRTAGPIFQSGVTTSLVSGEKNISRRRMADFIQDSTADAVVPFCKLPLTQSRKDAALGELDAFLSELKSENNPAASRITDYQLDDVSGNTPSLEAKGIHVIIVRVRLTPNADFIVLQTEIGENVTIPTVTQLAA